MNENRLRFAWFLLILSQLVSGWSVIDLQLIEIARLGYTCHDGGSNRKPVIHYPYVYFPDSYGIQVCEWDSVSNTFTRLNNIGWPGMTMELADGGNSLYAQVSYSSYTDVSPDMPALLRIDTSNPVNPVVTATLSVEDSDVSYSHFRVAGDFLLAVRQEGSALTSLMLLNPQTLETEFEYPEYYRFELLTENRLITRVENETAFKIFAISENGLDFETDLLLPYDVNQFPVFHFIGEATIAAQFCDHVDIWDRSNITDWQFLNTIDVNGIHSSTATQDFYIMHWLDASTYCYMLDVYDITDPCAPILLSSQPYPQEATISMLPYSNLFSQGSFIFQQGGSPGFFNLKLQDDGAISWGERPYDFNVYMAAGRKYSDYLLLPTAFEGLHCIDVSDPYNPIPAYQILDNSCVFPEVNGNMMLVKEYPDHQLDYGFNRLYNISDIENPVLILSEPLSANTEFFFNPYENDILYSVDSAQQLFTKYSIQDDEVSEMWTWDCGLPVINPVFSDGYLYCLEEFGPASRDLWVFGGFGSEQPELIQTYDNYIASSSILLPTGNFVFERDINPGSTFSRFMNWNTEFSVDQGIRAFGWEDIVGVSHDSYAHFYDVLTEPSGFVEPFCSLPQNCPIEYIERDNNFMYVFTNSNVAIYSYSIVGVGSNDDVCTQPALTSYPNPFNPETTIQFTLEHSNHVNLTIFNIKGQCVATLINESLPSGMHDVTWAPSNQASGVYLARLQTDESVKTIRLLLLK